MDKNPNLYAVRRQLRIDKEMLKYKGILKKSRKGDFSESEAVNIDTNAYSGLCAICFCHLGPVYP